MAISSPQVQQSNKPSAAQTGMDSVMKAMGMVAGIRQGNRAIELEENKFRQEQKQADINNSISLYINNSPFK